MPTCIYCKVDKKPDLFNKEHVLHDSFGSFNNTLTLINKVCASCNSLCGDTIDRLLARDTIEGFKRTQYGLKKNEDFKTEGKSSKIKIRVCEGLLKGLAAYLFLDQKQKKILLKPLPQIGLRKGCGTYDFFAFENIPSFELTSYNKYPCSERMILIPPGVDIDDAIEALKSKGYNYSYTGESELDLENILCEVTRVIDIELQRVMAKIAFNFFAYFNDENVILSHNFDKVRNFVLHGQPLIKIKVDNESILDDEKTANSLRLGHIITLEKDHSNSIIIQISLFNTFRYTVELSGNNNSNYAVNVGFGRFFDVHNMTINEIRKTPLLIPSINLRIPKVKILM